MKFQKKTDFAECHVFNSLSYKNFTLDKHISSNINQEARVVKEALEKI